MSKPRSYSIPVPLENTNLKARIDSLLFDILIDNTLLPAQIMKAQMMHNHSVFELHQIVSGTGMLWVGDREEPVKEGHIYLIGPNIFHAIKPHSGQTITHCTIRFAFRDTSQHDDWFPSHEIAEIKKALSNVTFSRLSDSVWHPFFSRLVEEIQAEIRHPSLGVFANVQGLFIQLIIHLVRSLSSKIDGEEPRKLPSKFKDELRSRIVDMFFINFKKPLTIEMLAAELNLSVKQVNRLLLQNYHTTFKQKLLDMRVEEAKALLRAGNLSIQRIAEEIGYSSSDNLCRVFMKKTGMTPSEFRKSYQFSRSTTRLVRPDDND